MIILRRVASIASWILRRDRAESRLDDEVRSFVEMSTADKIRDGVPADEARRLALIELGGVEQVKEGVRAGRHGALLDDVGRDVRYAFRLFARQPTFAVVIVGTLALGIGANTAIFSIVDSLMLRTLPIAEPERLAQFVAEPPSGQQRGPIRSGRRSSGTPIVSTACSRGPGSTRSSTWRKAAKTSTRMACGPAPRVSTCSASSRRGAASFASDDARGGGADGPVVVISHAFWQKHFAGAPDAIGRTLTLDRVPMTVIGVTPPDSPG